MLTILAVDDSATMRTCLEIAFDGTDIALVVCDNAAVALDKVATLRPALVLVDASLPPTTGYDLCAAIKGSAVRGGASAIPVVLLTSKFHPFDPVRGVLVDGYVDKPFDTQGLYDKVKAVLAGGVKSHQAPTDLGTPVDLSKTMSFGEPIVPPVPVVRRSVPPPRAFPRTQLGLPPLVEDPSETVDIDVDVSDVDASDVDASGVDAFDEPLPEPPVFIEPLAAPGPSAGAASQPRARSVTASWELPAEVAAMRATKQAVGDIAAREADFEAKLPAQAPTVDGPSTGEQVPTAEVDASAEVYAPAEVHASADVHHESSRPVTASWEVPAAYRDFAAAVPDEAEAVDETPAPHEVAFEAGLEGLGLTDAQTRAVIALSREVIERVVWEVVPTLAETIIKEELRRLTQG